MNFIWKFTLNLEDCQVSFSNNHIDHGRWNSKSLETWQEYKKHKSPVYFLYYILSWWYRTCYFKPHIPASQKTQHNKHFLVPMQIDMTIGVQSYHRYLAAVPSANRWYILRSPPLEILQRFTIPTKSRTLLLNIWFGLDSFAVTICTHKPWLVMVYKL